MRVQVRGLGHASDAAASNSARRDHGEHCRRQSTEREKEDVPQYEQHLKDSRLCFCLRFFVYEHKPWLHHAILQTMFLSVPLELLSLLLPAFHTRVDHHRRSRVNWPLLPSSSISLLCLSSRRQEIWWFVEQGFFPREVLLIECLFEQGFFFRRGVPTHLLTYDCLSEAFWCNLRHATSIIRCSSLCQQWWLDHTTDGWQVPSARRFCVSWLSAEYKPVRCSRSPGCD